MNPESRNIHNSSTAGTANSPQHRGLFVFFTQTTGMSRFYKGRSPNQARRQTRANVRDRLHGLSG
jgi:hypothetical protein